MSRDMAMHENQTGFLSRGVGTDSSRSPGGHPQPRRRHGGVGGNHTPLDPQAAARLEYLVAARVAHYTCGEGTMNPAPSSGREPVGTAGHDGVSVASGGLPDQRYGRVPVGRSRGSSVRRVSDATSQS
jgi:hypothetical protein